MRVAFFHSSLGSGGAERLMCSLSNYFVSGSIDTKIILTQKQPHFYKLDNRVKCIERDDTCKSRIENFFALMKFIRKTVKDEKVDVIVSMSSHNIIFILPAIIFLKCKVISCERSNPFLVPEKKIMRFLKWFISMFSDGYVFQTKGASTFYPKITQKKAIIIPNPALCPDDDYTYNSDSKKIVSVGSLRYQKGFDILINAFSLILKDFPEYSLHIYGKDDGDMIWAQGKNLKELVSRLGLDKKVIFEGNSVNIYKSINDAALYILSSRQEGMPNSLIEAMSLGLPCIATNCNYGPSELIENGVNGILVEVNNINEMADAIKKMLNDKQLRCVISENAKKILEKNSMRKIANIWMEYIKLIYNK